MSPVFLQKPSPRGHSTFTTILPLLHSMDPLSLTVSGLTILQAAAQAASSAKQLHSNYRDAEKQTQHAQCQREQLESCTEQFQSLPPLLKDKLALAEFSLLEVKSTLLEDYGVPRKRDRLRWATERKAKFGQQMNTLKQAEISTTLALSLQIASELDATKKMLEEHTEALNQFIMSQQLGYLHCKGHSTSSLGRRKHAQAFQCRWLAQYTAILGSLVISRDNDHSEYSLNFRWILFSLVLTWRLRLSGFFPGLPFISLRPRRVIPSDSPILEACTNGNVATMKALFSSRRAHPSDVTEDNLTLLRFAIRGGHLEAVSFLLDNGADPNMTFGQRETSPLNNAFFFGDKDVIRVLLKKGADLDYINLRAWTSLSYLWDPERSNHESVPIILDICFTERFSGWNYSDRVGWAPIHRAAAFGQARDIERIRNLGFMSDEQTELTHWTPLQCAVRFGNVSTFHALTENISACVLPKIKDTRGWSLLHLAAASGSYEIMKLLLEVECDPNSLSDSATILLPEELEEKPLCARDIARHYGHVEAFERVLGAVGVTDQTHE